MLRRGFAAAAGRLGAVSKAPTASVSSSTSANKSSLIRQPLVGEWEELPEIFTEIPGPETKAQLADFAAGWGGTGSALNLVLDIPGSQGVFMKDIDGNKILDCFGQIASLPLGWNHPKLLEVARSDAMVQSQVNRTALGSFIPEDWTQLVADSLGKVAPPGMSKVQTMPCGSSANENAFKVAMISHRRKARAAEGRDPDSFSEDELSSVMVNAAPGCANELKILSFDGSFHGRTFGALSATHSKAIHKLDVPSLDWPNAPFPELRYPLAQHVAENEAEEARCLAAVERIIEANNGAIAGMIIEPMQAEGGDRHGRPEFFRQLREIASKHDITFIVDEVQTGVVASGEFWAHQHWGLETPPDIVTFSKKALTGGYYYTEKLQMTLPYRIYNTWMGDPCKLHQLKAVISVIEEDGLVTKTQEAGNVLLAGLEAMADRFPTVVANARGMGTLCAFDLPNPAARDDVFNRARNSGVLAGFCGDRTIRFRPPLNFTAQHAQVVLDIFTNAILDHLDT